MKSTLLLTAAAMTLAACTANDKSIHRNITPPKDRVSVQSVDAKQRFLIMVPTTEELVTQTTTSAEAVETTETTNSTTTVPSAPAPAASTGQSPGTATPPPAPAVTRETLVTKTRKPQTSTTSRALTTTSVRYCAEPSPDVFSVYANSAAANASVDKGAAAGPLSLLFGFSGSSAEQGSTIARTQTINLLKEVMYRTCERYANGGIGPLELGVQAIRDQRLIIAALAIEQLTGAVMPKPTIIGAAGSAGTGADAAGAVVAIDKAFTEKVAADSALEKAEAKLAAADGDKKLCQPADKRPEGADKPTEAQTKACETATADVGKAKTAAALAKTRVDLLTDAAKSGGPISAAMTNLLAAQGSGGIDAADTDNMKDVAEVVKSIVMANYDASELELLCIKSFDPKQGTLNENVVKACENYFNSLIEQKRARADRLAAADQRLAAEDRTAAAIEIMRSQFIQKTAKDFEIFWNLEKDERSRRIDIALKKSDGFADDLKRLKEEKDTDSARKIFSDLSSPVRKILLKGNDK